MKRMIVPAGLVLLLLAGCASIPEPEGSDDTLLAGFVTIDYVDRFFSLGPREFKSGLTVTLYAHGSKETVTTRTDQEGFFALPADDERLWSIYSVSHTEKIADVNYESGGLIRRTFQVEPGSVTYLGAFKLVFKAPAQVSHSERANRKERTWDFEESVEHRENPDAFGEYFETKFEGSSWLSRPVARPRWQ
jgi:hypothetical protein